MNTLSYFERVKQIETTFFVVSTDKTYESFEINRSNFCQSKAEFCVVVFIIVENVKNRYRSLL